MHPVRKLLSDIINRRVGTGPVKKLSDDALKSEWRYWDNKIKTAKSSGGAAVSAANEFRRECERELNRRNITIPTPISEIEENA